MLYHPQTSEPSIIQCKPDLQEWHVAYTFPKAEKKVQCKLDKIGIQSFLPLHQVVRNWSDRKKKLIVPLFPNYIFIQTSPDKKHEIYNVKEIVRFVCFGGKPATVKDSVVSSLKNILRENIQVNIEKYTKTGSPVKITQGLFAGTEGFLIRRNGKTQLLVQVDALQQGITITISGNDINPFYTEWASMDSFVE